MGNEVSSVKVHTLLTAEDLKLLRTKFPGGGSGTPPNNLSWGVWKEVWPPELLKTLELQLSPGNFHPTLMLYVFGTAIKSEAKRPAKTF